MPLSMYQASIPVFVRFLDNLSEILNKALIHAETRKIDPAVFVTSRLAPDMYPLSRQVQIATDIVKGCAARLAGIEVPSYEDNETTFVAPSQIDGSEERTVTLKLRGKDVSFLGQPYLLNFVIPNFYFHVTTTYAILRHNGVEIGKMDFIGGK